MHFGAPVWLNGLLLVPLLWLLIRRGRKKRREALERFGSPGLLAHLVRGADDGKRRRKERLFLAGMTGVVFALAHPQYGEKQTPMTREGIDLVFAIDASLSMLAEDQPPSRLERARGEVAGALSRLKGDRVGIVSFAGTSLPTCPPTVDYGAVRIFLGALDPWTVPTGGTAIAKALRRSIHMLRESAAGSKAVVLLTDGEDHEGDVLSAADEAAEAGIRIFTIALGSAEGELIPLPKGEGPGFKKDRGGELVVSRRNDQLLREVAARTGGRAFELENEPDALDRILDALSGMEKREFRSRVYVLREERYVWFLLPATLLLFLEFLLGTSGEARKGVWSGRIE
ncbi:MAG: VWA domain-containing protein [Candidatus Eisenbacteria bacterium]